MRSRSILHRAASIVAFVAALLFLAPLVSAFVDHDLPHFQAQEENRRVETSRDGTLASVNLFLDSDPLVNLVRFRVDPAHGLFESEFRRDDSDASAAFRTRVTLTRFLEYRDLNADLHFENGSDMVVHSWRLDAYKWETTPWRAVFIGGQQAQDTAWAANASGAPDLKFELGAAGLAFTDEGARVRQQDVVVYVDMKNFPPRGVGNLYAIEGTISSTPGASPSVHVVTDANGTKLPVALLVTTPDRLGFFDWGGQATLDKVEQNLNVSLFSGSDASGDSSFVVEFPRFDKTARMVLVSGVEYRLPDKRSPEAGVAAILATLGVLSLALSTVKRR